jgi:hypothetical protein
MLTGNSTQMPIDWPMKQLHLQRQNLQAHLLHKLKWKEMQKWEDPYFHNLEAADEGVECVKLMQHSFWQQSPSVH